VFPLKFTWTSRQIPCLLLLLWKAQEDSLWDDLEAQPARPTTVSAAIIMCTGNHRSIPPISQQNPRLHMGTRGAPKFFMHAARNATLSLRRQRHAHDTSPAHAPTCCKQSRILDQQRQNTRRGKNEQAKNNNPRSQ
jgi:hypothetical protein